jgi:hypothetical protein
LDANLKEAAPSANTQQYWKFVGTSWNDVKLESYSGYEIAAGGTESTDRYKLVAQGSGN